LIVKCKKVKFVKKHVKHIKTFSDCVHVQTIFLTNVKCCCWHILLKKCQGTVHFNKINGEIFLPYVTPVWYFVTFCYHDAHSDANISVWYTRGIMTIFTLSYKQASNSLVIQQNHFQNYSFWVCVLLHTIDDSSVESCTVLCEIFTTI